MATTSILASGREKTKTLAEEAANAAYADLMNKGKSPELPDYEETEHGACKWEIRG